MSLPKDVVEQWIADAEASGQGVYFPFGDPFKLTPLERAQRVVTRERRKLLRMSTNGRCRPRRLKRQAMLVQKREIRLLRVRDAE